MTMDTSKVLRLPRTHLLKTSQKYCACHAKQFSTRYETRLNVTKRSNRCVKPPKVTPFAELTIGTAIRPSRGHLRTVADGCEHKRSSEHTLNPQTPRVKREPLLRILEKGKESKGHSVQHTTAARKPHMPLKKNNI